MALKPVVFTSGLSNFFDTLFNGTDWNEKELTYQLTIEPEDIMNLGQYDPNTGIPIDESYTLAGMIEAYNEGWDNALSLRQLIEYILTQKDHNYIVTLMQIKDYSQRNPMILKQIRFEKLDLFVAFDQYLSFPPWRLITIPDLGREIRPTVEDILKDDVFYSNYNDIITRLKLIWNENLISYYMSLFLQALLNQLMYENTYEYDYIEITSDEDFEERIRGELLKEELTPFGVLDANEEKYLEILQEIFTPEEGRLFNLNMTTTNKLGIIIKKETIKDLPVLEIFKLFLDHLPSDYLIKNTVIENTFRTLIKKYIRSEPRFLRLYAP